jgi:hypothetical protein
MSLLEPSLVLSILVGVFNVALFVFLGGQARGRLPFLALASVLGAYAGQAIGTHVGDPLRIGDFGLLSASVVAWAGMAVVAIVSTLGPSDGA